MAPCRGADVDDLFRRPEGGTAVGRADDEERLAIVAFAGHRSEELVVGHQQGAVRQHHRLRGHQLAARPTGHQHRVAEGPAAVIRVVQKHVKAATQQRVATFVPGDVEPAVMRPAALVHRHPRVVGRQRAGEVGRFRPGDPFVVAGPDSNGAVRQPPRWCRGPAFAGPTLQHERVQNIDTSVARRQNHGVEAPGLLSREPRLAPRPSAVTRQHGGALQRSPGRTDLRDADDEVRVARAGRDPCLVPVTTGGVGRGAQVGPDNEPRFAGRLAVLVCRRRAGRVARDEDQ